MAKPEKLPSGRWRLRYLDDRGKRQTAVFDTKRQAEEYGDSIRTQVRAGLFIDPELGKQTMDEWAAELFAMDTLAPSTLRMTKRVYRVDIQPMWGRKQLSSINRTSVEKWIGELVRGTHRGKGKSVDLMPRTIERTYGVFRKIVRAAYAHKRIGLLDLPPRPKLPRAARKKERFLTEGEIEHLAGHMTPRWRPMVYVGCYCGLRINEIGALRVNDFDFMRHTVRVDEAITDLDGSREIGLTKTDSSDRVVPMPTRVEDAVRAHITELVGWTDEEELVFTGERGGQFNYRNWLKLHWNPAVERSGLDRLTPHDMRHTAGSLWISEGASSLMVVRLLGQVDSRMVDRVYGHLFDKDKEQLQQRMSDRAERGVAEKRTVIPLRKTGEGLA